MEPGGKMQVKTGSAAEAQSIVKQMESNNVRLAEIVTKNGQIVLTGEKVQPSKSRAAVSLGGRVKNAITGIPRRLAAPYVRLYNAIKSHVKPWRAGPAEPLTAAAPAKPSLVGRIGSAVGAKLGAVKSSISRPLGGLRSRLGGKPSSAAPSSGRRSMLMPLGTSLRPGSAAAPSGKRVSIETAHKIIGHSNV
jgi:hypothetical protein